MINILVPMKAMSEYADIHEKILKYVLKRDDKPLEEKYEKMFNSLIRALNVREYTLGSVLLFHVAIMSFRPGNVGFVLFTLYAAIFIWKFTQYHYFMTSPSTENA